MHNVLYYFTVQISFFHTVQIQILVILITYTRFQVKVGLLL